MTVTDLIASYDPALAPDPLAPDPLVPGHVSWRDLPAAQQPDWPDQSALAAVMADLGSCAPLVLPEESDRLRDRLAAVARGEAVLIQGGDCAETFGGTSERQIRAKLTTLDQMATVLSAAAGLPAIRIGRIAGQYSKPRSNPTEVIDGLELPVYRGDSVNSVEFTPEARRPDPERLRRAYHSSAVTLNLIRAVTGGAETEAVYTSHEALILDYEAALTRRDSRTGRYYAGSGHLLWIGERTRQLDGAHLAFAARVDNPVAVKLGPSATADEAMALIDLLDPEREPGRLTFITRMGARQIRDVLPELVAKVTASGAQVAWVCDPMHGNTFTSPTGHKTRRVADIADEAEGFLAVHRELGTHPGGFHLEFTGDFVTECVGGTDEVTFEDLGRRYESTCDPRLNRGQALDLAFSVADRYRSA
ncbi:3-deoxy-7-phosphoheptulonate synthase class II [Kitasatospora sp. MAP5-34]|uniref:3-deoxy-7-phosphoheptulonate synthase class II n=1 Tax=Kitasatospora sp. MAP5-34 TaxID=3035102 RepID=UPI0024751504|nr:3-deoxy-7-phosphoheptulonate synthase class II [Kitasatospora sp. MAP5-34]MDH6579069.1 3-deoxy-7-phosphoheptulonate synthase [Kitasatospora sp. MAP5-34]